jgi:ADP-heptose:LPS heptosyltransferase
MREDLIAAGCRVIGAITGRLASRQDTVLPPDPRIVVIRACCLGDVLQSTAMLDALRRRFPLSRIDYATSAYAAPALEGNPDVTAVIAPDAGALRRGRYDVAITLDRSPAIGMLAWLARIRVRVGPNSQSRGFAHNLRIACPPDRSEAELWLECAAALGAAVDGARPKFCPSDADRAWAELTLGHGGERWVAIAPGGGVNPGMRLTNKRWPAERFAAVANRLAGERRLRVALLGGQDDRQSCSQVEAAIESTPLNLCGRLSFGRLGAVIAHCRLFVGNDSAPLHLAPAVGTPWVGLFGPSDPVRHRPLGRGEVVAAPVPRSAYRDGFASVDCMHMIAVQDVLAACARVLDHAQ